LEGGGEVNGQLVFDLRGAGAHHHHDVFAAGEFPTPWSVVILAMMIIVWLMEL